MASSPVASQSLSGWYRRGGKTRLYQMAKAKAGLAWFQTMGRLSWFPGHMAKATREIKERLKVRSPHESVKGPQWDGLPSSACGRGNLVPAGSLPARRFGAKGDHLPRYNAWDHGVCG